MQENISKHEPQANCEVINNDVRNIIWCILAGVTFAIIGIMIMVYRMDEQEHMKTRDVDSIQATRVSENTQQEKYQIRFENQKVCIYLDDEFYDYADIEVDNLPKDLYDKLEDGIGLSDEQELYEFLQTYSS